MPNETKAVETTDGDGAFKIIPLPSFLSDVKKLAKKYRSIVADIDAVAQQLKTTPELGTPLGKNCFKIRIKIDSLKRGRSGGGRLITCVQIIDKTVYMVAVYDKNIWDNIPDEELKKRLKEI